MITGFGWVDFSSEHRDRVRTVIDLLSTPGVVDELGIGVIRDTFADFLFPGVSTIQTRPKYFLLVPRILKDYEALPDKHRQRTPLRDYLAEQEMACRVQLAKRYNNAEGLGIIGVTFGSQTDKDILRPPSSVYWNGVKAFGIVRTPLSLPEFYRRYTGHRPSLRMLLEETKEMHGDDVDADDVNLSPIRLPKHDTWQEKLSITLTREEAEFLRIQITATQPQSLIGQILLDSKATEQFVMLSAQASFHDLAELPFLKQMQDGNLRHVVYLADAFWEILYGAHVRYNLLLQQRFGSSSGLAETESIWQEWMENMRAFDWGTWNTQEIWDLVANHGSRLHPWTKKFVGKWIEAAACSETKSEVYDKLVIDQEIANKRSRARLRLDNRDEAVEQWIGIQSLSYRLPQVKTLVNDIHRAETGKADPDAGL